MLNWSGVVDTLPINAARRGDINACAACSAIEIARQVTGLTMQVPGARHHTTRVNGIKVHYAEAGKGAPVFLLHGFPETWFAWRKQIPELSKHYKVIAPDLRGYGDTEKALTGYDKRTMANDIYALMRHLGYSKIALIGHDRGARVATRFAKDHRNSIDRLAVLDNVPTRIIHDSMDMEKATGQWFFIFNQVPDLPETLIRGNEEQWLRFIYHRWCYDPMVLSDEETAVYVKAFQMPGAVRGAMDDYRAMPQDVAQDKEDADQLIDCPVLALWGTEFELVGRMFDVQAIWKGMAHNVKAVSIPQCGHLPHEERPEEVNRALLDFLDGWKG